MIIRGFIKILLLLLVTFSQLHSDEEIEKSWFVKFFPLVIHPTGGDMEEYYKSDLSDNGWLAMGAGGIGGVDFYNSNRHDYGHPYIESLHLQKLDLSFQPVRLVVGN